MRIVSAALIAIVLPLSGPAFADDLTYAEEGNHYRLLSPAREGIPARYAYYADGRSVDAVRDGVVSTDGRSGTARGGRCSAGLFLPCSKLARHVDNIVGGVFGMGRRF